MKGWKIALLILIGLLFVISATLTIIWYSLSTTALNSNTYKNLITTDTIKQLAGNQLPPEFIANLDSFLPSVNSWFDSVFNYINGKTSNLELKLPDDSIMKPLLIQIAKQTNSETSQLTDAEFNAMFDQQYPAIKQNAQTQLDNASLSLEQQLKDYKDIISFANTIALITLIISLVLLLITVLLIKQLRSIFNWIGSYLLIVGVIVVVFGAIIISVIPIALASLPEQTMVSAITSFISGLISPIIIIGAIVGIIGFAMLLIKLAFKKPEEQPIKS